MRGKFVLLGGLAQRWAPAKKIFTQTSAFLLVLVILFSAVPFEVDAASSTSNYWYNGVELPPLPTDVSANNFIICLRSSGSYVLYSFPKSYNVFYSSSKAGITTSENAKIFSGYLVESDNWVYQNVYTGFSSDNVTKIWSSSTIYVDDTTNVYIPSSNYGALPYSQKDIYSYNDLIAPSVFNFSSSQETLDEHPYLYIFQNKFTLEYEFIASWTKIFYRLHSSNGYYYYLNGASISSIYYPYYFGVLSDGVWTFTAKTGSVYNYVSDYDIIWASVDILDYNDSSNVIFEGSDAVPLGNLTSLYTVLPEDDKWEVKQGGSKRFEIASGQNLPIETVTWQLKGNIVSGTSIDYNGLLTVSSNQPLGTIYVVASNINGEGYSSEAAVTVVPEQTPNTDYVIRPQSTGTYYVGNSYNFSCVNSSGGPASSVVWSVYSDYVPIASGTYIDSSGTLYLSSSQNAGNLTIQASSINGTDTYTFYNISVFANMSGDDGGGGDNPSPSPTPGNQEVIDSIDEGFTGLGNKIDQLGNNIIAGFLEGLLRLFVPTTDELTAKMDSFKEWIDDQIPILAVPVALVQYTYDMFFGVTPELGVLTFPEVKWMDNILIERTELDLSQYTWLNDILPIIRTVLTVGCCLSFLYWVINKVKEVGKS